MQELVNTPMHAHTGENLHMHTLTKVSAHMPLVCVCVGVCNTYELLSGAKVLCQLYELCVKVVKAAPHILPPPQCNQSLLINTSSTPQWQR